MQGSFWLSGVLLLQVAAPLLLLNILFIVLWLKSKKADDHQTDLVFNKIKTCKNTRKKEIAAFLENNLHLTETDEQVERLFKAERNFLAKVLKSYIDRGKGNFCNVDDDLYQLLAQYFQLSVAAPDNLSTSSAMTEEAPPSDSKLRKELHITLRALNDLFRDYQHMFGDPVNDEHDLSVQEIMNALASMGKDGVIQNSFADAPPSRNTDYGDEDRDDSFNLAEDVFDGEDIDFSESDDDFESHEDVLAALIEDEGAGLEPIDDEMQATRIFTEMPDEDDDSFAIDDIDALIAAGSSTKTPEDISMDDDDIDALIAAGSSTKTPEDISMDDDDIDALIAAGSSTKTPEEDISMDDDDIDALIAAGSSTKMREPEDISMDDDDIDALIAAGSSTKMPVAEEISMDDDDIDALIAAGSSTKMREPEDISMDDDDIDALIAAGFSQNKKEPDDISMEDDDIDALLNSTRKELPKAEKLLGDDDIESMLDLTELDDSLPAEEQTFLLDGISDAFEEDSVTMEDDDVEALLNDLQQIDTDEILDDEDIDAILKKK